MNEQPSPQSSPPPLRLPRMWIQNGFLPSFLTVREKLNRAEFGTVESPVDGIKYPFIDTSVAEEHRDEIGIGLVGLLDRPLKINWLFTRLSPEGVVAPHQVHTDASMGQYSAMIYMNYDIHARRYGMGTSILKHRNGTLNEHPTDAIGEGLWARDCNMPDRWLTTAFCPARENRAFVFDSKLLHRAEPLGGFGLARENARCVMTCFFDVVPE